MEGQEYVKCHAGNDVISETLIPVHSSFRKMAALGYFGGTFPFLHTMCINISAMHKRVSL
jgi:hypothetical protein